jgi:hypothetical protein
MRRLIAHSFLEFVRQYFDGPKRGTSGDVWTAGGTGARPSWTTLSIPTDYGKNIMTASFTIADATAAGSRKVGLGNLALTEGGIFVPSGRTMQIVRANGTLKTGATAGSNYDLRLIVRAFTAATDTDLQSSDDNAQNVWVGFESGGAIDGTLTEIVGPEFVVPGWRVVSGSTGALANVPHHCEIGYFFHDT